MPRTHTFTYAKRDSLDLVVDVWVPGQPSLAPLPVVVWFHGGGLVQGSRTSLAGHHKRAIDERNVIIVSPDYRLAPQARVPDIQQDLVALTQWVDKSLQAGLKEVGSNIAVDLTRIAVSGSSVGGWLALWTALGMVQGVEDSFLQRIRIVAPIYPITTMDHPFFLEKQIPFMGPLDIPFERFAELKNPSAQVVSDSIDMPLRQNLYRHAQQEALFPELLFSPEQLAQGWLQTTDVPRFISTSNSRLQDGWPPVYMIHGVQDTAVDIDQARKVRDALRKSGTEVVLEEREGMEHMWDRFEPEERLQTYWDFVSARLEGQSRTTASK